ncbi:MAG: recombinase family protein [Eubacteriales bacterium]|nr:recombinase family protein [Eubacteriales bacterium]
MVIAGKINRVAFYCRVNHRDRDYEKYLDDVMKRLEEKYGKQKWDLQIFFEEASGADPDRKEFNRLKMEIAAKKIDVVVTMKAATIARDWGQFIEFMAICSKNNVEVLCIDEIEDAQAVFQRIQEFKKMFFERSGVPCE